MARGLLAAALLLLLLGAVVLVPAERSVFARVPLLDEVWYLDRAAELEGPAPPADEPHFMSPLYPVLLKLAGAGGGVPADRVVPPGALRGLRIAQLACWLGAALLLRVAAGRLVPADAPARGLLVWLPTVLVALYRPAAVYALAVLVEAPLLLLVTAALVLLVARPATVGAAAAAGALLGLAGLLRGTVLALAPVAAVWVAVAAPRRPWRGGLLVVATVLVLAPAVVHNTRASGRLAPPTLNAGVNLAIGNGPHANGFYVAVVPGDWREDPAGRAHLGRELGRAPLSLAEADSVWAARARAHMADRPAATAGLWLRKAWLHLQTWEIDQLMPLDGWRRTVAPLALLAAPWGAIVVLALVGAVAGRTGRGAVRWPLVTGAAALLAAQSVFFVVSRYRLVLLPLLALLAALGAAALLRRTRRAFVVLPLAALLVVPWGLGDVQQRWRAQALANEALREATWARARQDTAAGARAVRGYRRAIAAGADGPAPWLGLAALLRERGDRDAAIEVLGTGVLHRPDDPALRRELVSQLLQAGREDEALARLRALLERWPDDADARHNLIVLLAARGRLTAALAHAERLVDAAPDDPRGWNDLGILLARLGRREAAADAFRRGLEAVPGDPDLTTNLERLDAGGR